MILSLAVIPLCASTAQAVQSEERRESSIAPATAAVAHPTLPPFMSPLRPNPIDSELRSSVFAVDATAQAGLETLWKASKRVMEERVACIAGHMEDGAFHVTRVMAVPTEKADSLRISPEPSLDLCGPPDWIGTVHTHIASFHGKPFATLSPSDRAVMNVWRLKWKQEGVFCVLYSESEAYCEYGTTLNDDVQYSAKQQDRAHR